MDTWLVRATLAASVVVLLFLSPAQALPRYGPIELSGSVAAQQQIRFNPDIDKLALVTQRNTLKLRLEYTLLDRGKLADTYDVPFVGSTRLFLLYRGVYDSVYDSTPGFEQRNIYGEPIHLRLDDLGGRKGLKFENRLREGYFDVRLKQIPLSFRLGRQQIVWGETDNFRMLDRVNALDLSWHLQQDPWDELRMPYWMIKGLYDLDRIGPLSSAFLEFYWNPGDWDPAKRDFLPQPWSAPITNPLPTLIDAVHLLRIGLPKPTHLYHDTTLFGQGDYVRDPIENSQVGVRVSAVTPQGVQFTLNYFYQRWAGGDDGTNTAAFRAILDPAEVDAALARRELPIVSIAPYVHAAGFSLNYAEDEYTKAVLRMESVYEFGVPFTDASQRYTTNTPSTRRFALISKDLFGVGKRDMWKGMIAFDRPTWIRLLNRNSTFLILGQFFWHYLLDNPNILCVDRSESPPCTKSGQAKGFRGQFSTSGMTSGTAERNFTAGPAYIDKVRDWEMLVTLAATTFYSGGKVVPFFVYVLDPMNSYNMEAIWMLDYFLSNNLILNLSQRYFINTTSRPVFETWGVAGTNRGRSETGIRLTYTF
jgi:hypothetical protein